MGDKKRERDPSPFLSYSAYLKSLYGTRAFRVAVDGGFSCPNRGAERSGRGCTYCDGFGALATYQRHRDNRRCRPVRERFGDIAAQIDKASRFLEKRYGAEILLLYFQAFTNTFAPLEELRQIYDYALSRRDFRELIVSTRPDSLSAGTAELLASYRRASEGPRDVWVELGLQTMHDATLKRIRRGHSLEDFDAAFRRARDAGLKVAVHLILGLPGEDRREIEATCRYVAALRPDAVKFHNLHIPRNTELYQEYLQGEFAVPGPDRYRGLLIRAIRMLPPETVVMRLTCDTPGDLRAAPLNHPRKTRFYQEVRDEMGRQGWRQGDRFSE